jgi:hypothetical protein
MFARYNGSGAGGPFSINKRRLPHPWVFKGGYYKSLERGILIVM